MPEFKILSHIVEYMESTGHISKLVHLSIDQKFTDELNLNYQNSYSLKEIEKATDKCLAHEWLKHTAMGGDKYATEGISINITNRLKTTAKQRRPFNSSVRHRGSGDIPS